MQQIKDVLSGIFQELRSPQKTVRQTLLAKWPEIAGARIAKDTKPVLMDDGRLIVWVSQSVLAFEIRQRYQPGLLKRAQAALGESTVKSIRIYVGQIR